jgi:hypothetical protein
MQHQLPSACLDSVIEMIIVFDSDGLLVRIKIANLQQRLCSAGNIIISLAENTKSWCRDDE